MTTGRDIPIDVVDLLPALHKKLIELLRSLTPEEWEQQTIARLWTVKDVAAHLLDGNIRILSMLRDGYQGEKANINSQQDLIDFLNGLNAEWVRAMKRVSPEMLIFLHELTGPLYCNYYRSVDPFDRAGFAVDWAGESESKNWMHIAREYTEKWLHQQQILDATGRTGIMTQEFFYPFMDIFMMALPYTYRSFKAEEGTIVKVTITGDTAGSWFLTRSHKKWVLEKDLEGNATTEVILDPDTSWKLFSKSLRPADVEAKVIIKGDQEIGAIALNMVSVMA
jgi:uncharacterized protein (TIGR03083 family)